MTKDLHKKGDSLWQFPYPSPERMAMLGAARVHDAAEDDELTIVSYSNGLYMSLQAQARLREEGIRARVLDLRWLAPLDLATVKEHALATGRLLIVDECRGTMGGPSALIMAELAQDSDCRELRMRRLHAVDSYVPLGPAANLVLVQVVDIVRTAGQMMEPVS